MTLTAIPAAGAKLRGSVLSSLITEVRPITASKGSTTSRNTTIVHAVDPDLTLALPASSTWDFEAMLLLSSAANAAGDFSFSFAYPSDATVSTGAHGLDIAIASGVIASLLAGTATSVDATSPSTNGSIGCSTTATMSIVVGRITVVTAGSLTLQWSQDSSNANNTNLLAGSKLVARRAA